MIVDLYVQMDYALMILVLESDAPLVLALITSAQKILVMESLVHLEIVSKESVHQIHAKE